MLTRESCKWRVSWVRREVKREMSNMRGCRLTPWNKCGKEDVKAGSSNVSEPRGTSQDTKRGLKSHSGQGVDRRLNSKGAKHLERKLGSMLEKQAHLL